MCGGGQFVSEIGQVRPARRARDERMSVVRMSKAEDGPTSGGAMDRVVEKKGFSTRVKIGHRRRRWR